jgi:hypothetical protein
LHGLTRSAAADFSGRIHILPPDYFRCRPLVRSVNFHAVPSRVAMASPQRPALAVRPQKGWLSGENDSIFEKSENRGAGCGMMVSPALASFKNLHGDQ